MEINFEGEKAVSLEICRCSTRRTHGDRGPLFPRCCSGGTGAAFKTIPSLWVAFVFIVKLGSYGDMRRRVKASKRKHLLGLSGEP